MSLSPESMAKLENIAMFVQANKNKLVDLSSLEGVQELIKIASSEIEDQDIVVRYNDFLWALSPAEEKELTRIDFNQVERITKTKKTYRGVEIEEEESPSKLDLRRGHDNLAYSSPHSSNVTVQPGVADLHHDAEVVEGKAKKMYRGVEIEKESFNENETQKILVEPKERKIKGYYRGTPIYEDD